MRCDIREQYKLILKYFIKKNILFLYEIYLYDHV